MTTLGNGLAGLLTAIIGGTGGSGSTVLSFANTIVQIPVQIGINVLL